MGRCEINGCRDDAVVYVHGIGLCAQHRDSHEAYYRIQEAATECTDAALRYDALFGGK